MNIVPSRIVIGVGLAVVGAGLVTYALHPSSTPAPIARVAPLVPPPPAVQAPEAPPPAAPAPDVAAPTPAAPPAVAQTDNGNANSDATPAVTPDPAVTPEPKANRHAKAHRSESTNDDSVAATAPAAPAPAPTGTASADSSANAGSDSVARNGDSVKPADASAAPATPATPAAGAVAAPVDGSQAADVANADSKITTEVKSRLAADSVTKDADLSVNTTQGVVVVTGTVATQDAVDHVKLVAQNVPDVKSVDTSALKVSG